MFQSMYQSTDPPPTTNFPLPPPPLLQPATAEPPTHIAYAANPTPSQAPNNHNHPPYAEMITAAITALKDKNGSSRQAIAKYIERAYSNLPATHSALLTHHLKRLKNNGQLLMVKHSYKLPGSPPSPQPLAPAPPPPPLSIGTTIGNGNVLSAGPKRGPGRPRKPKFDTEPINNYSGPGPESVLVSLGLVDDVAVVTADVTADVGVGADAGADTGVTSVGKRRPGRPARLGKSVGTTSEFGGKRGRGRPARPKLVSVLMDQKRRPGRPPKSGFVGSGKPRGRPKKSDGSMVMGKAVGRPRGRPPKNAVFAGDGGGGVGGGGEGGGAVGKRRGRPPRAAGNRVVKKPRKLTGKPVGRPRKNSSTTGIQAAAAQQLVAYEDLKNKLEHFQSRIKLAVSIVKPQLHITAVSALGSLQELEELATMDLGAPLNFQVQDQMHGPPLQN